MSATRSAPPTPRGKGSGPDGRQSNAQIVDVRERFAKKGPPPAEDSRRARAFIDSKIEMVKRDTRLSPAQKKAAIAELEAKR